MENDQNLRRTATLGALASVAIVIGIIVVVWLLFFRNNGSDNTSQQANGDNNQSQQAENEGAKNESPARSGTGDSDDSARDTADDKAQSGTTTPGKTDKNGKPLPNSGPRENVIVFVGTALAATGAYYVYTRRKLANS